jgi:hypothetical protein
MIDGGPPWQKELVRESDTSSESFAPLFSSLNLISPNLCCLLAAMGHRNE